MLIIPDLHVDNIVSDLDMFFDLEIDADFHCTLALSKAILDKSLYQGASAGAIAVTYDIQSDQIVVVYFLLLLFHCIL